MNESPSMERGKIFVWADYGKILSDLDKERVHSIIQQNAHRFLSLQANIEMDDIINEIKDNGYSDKVEKMIYELNKKDILFREINKFMIHQNDLLTLGTLITGEKDKKKMQEIMDYGDIHE